MLCSYRAVLARSIVLGSLCLSAEDLFSRNVFLSFLSSRARITQKQEYIRFKLKNKTRETDKPETDKTCRSFIALKLRRHRSSRFVASVDGLSGILDASITSSARKDCPVKRHWTNVDCRPARPFKRMTRAAVPPLPHHVVGPL